MMKVEKNGRALAQKPCESEQNSLSYDFFQNKVFWCMTWEPSPPPEYVFSKKS
jgi:hypothetical protein